MSESNVLILFYSRGGLTERLAVLLAEGAIQGGANIRLRRCRDVMPEEWITADPAWRANRDRMHDEFAAPRIQDVEWADLVAFGTPAAPGTTSAELATTLAHIGSQLPPELLRRKGATAFTSSYGPMPGAELAASDLAHRLLGLGFVCLPRPLSPARPEGVLSSHEAPASVEYEAARIHGRLAASLGRTLRGWSEHPTS